MSTIPSPGPWTDHPIVDLAEQQLRAYGEHVAHEPMTRERAEALLPFWAHYREMSAREIAATLERFGPATHPVWCNRKHTDGHPVHTAELGSVATGEATSIEVYLFQTDSEPPAVSIAMLVGVGDDALVELSPWKAYELADLLRDGFNRIEEQRNAGGAS